MSQSSWRSYRRPQSCLQCSNRWELALPCLSSLSTTCIQWIKLYIVKTSVCNPSLLCAGAGKSAVAEVLTLGRWDATERCALYVLPYVALCEQKAQSLVKLLRPLGRCKISEPLSQGVAACVILPSSRKLAILEAPATLQLPH